MLDLLKFFGHRELDQWRDEYTRVAAAVLNGAAGSLSRDFDKKADEAGYQQLLFGQSSFIEAELGPAVDEVGKRVTKELLDDANVSLRRIVEHQAHQSDIAHSGAIGGYDGDGLTEVAAAALPLAGGVAAAMAVHAGAVTTTSALFGLVTVTAISWPVVIVGGAVATAALATGVFNSARLRTLAVDRLRANGRHYINSVLVKGTPDRPSVLAQIETLLAKVAAEAKQL